MKSTEAVLDMTGDSANSIRAQKKVEKKWDPTKKKYVANNNKEKMIKSESGQWIPVSYKTDRYAKWQEKSKVRNAENSDGEEEAVKPLPGNKKNGQAPNFVRITSNYVVICRIINAFGYSLG